MSASDTADRPPGDDARPWALSRRGPGGAQEVWTGLPSRHTLANSPAMLLQLACAGVGVAAVADFFARPHVQAGRLQPVLPDWRLPPVPAWAVFPERRLMPAKTRALLEMLAAALPGDDDAAGAGSSLAPGA